MFLHLPVVHCIHKNLHNYVIVHTSTPGFLTKPHLLFYSKPLGENYLECFMFGYKAKVTKSSGFVFNELQPWQISGL